MAENFPILCFYAHQKNLVAQIKEGPWGIELRFDHCLLDEEEITNLISQLPIIPTIITDKVHFDRRFFFYQMLLKKFPHLLLDIDYKKENITAIHCEQLIVSAHLNSCEEVLSVFEKMRTLDKKIHKKIVLNATHLNQNLFLFEMLKKYAHEHRMSVFAMGEFSGLSRLLSPIFGSRFTYTYLEEMSQTAPGQISFEQLENFYHFRKIDKQTKIFGVIGMPVMHSLSPAFFNPKFIEQKINARYLHLPLNAQNFTEFKTYLLQLINFSGLNFSGASVTLPYKEYLYQVAKEEHWEIDDITHSLQAANTLKIEKSKISITNTDAYGFIDTLAIKEIQGMNFLILGAGGVARTIAGILHQLGAKVFIHARTLAKAQRLKDFATILSDKEQIFQHNYAAIINATPLGMTPNIQTSPLTLDDLRQFSSKSLLFDTVYTPEETQFLKWGQELGFQTCSGKNMFHYQANHQFNFWNFHESI